MVNLLDIFNFKKVNSNKLTLALLLILTGVLGRILLLDYPNIEPVLAMSLIAGVVLGSFYVVVVPITIMIISDILVYMLRYPGMYPFASIFGLALFVYSGYIFVSFMGRIVKKKIIFATKGIAVLTSVGVTATIIFDIWTAFGSWYFISSRAPYNWSLAHVYSLQVPFTLIHIVSSLIFVPIFGTIYIYVSKYGLPKLNLSVLKKRHEQPDKTINLITFR